MPNLFEMMAEAARQAQQRQQPQPGQPQSLEDAWRQAQAEWARRAQAAAGQRPAPGARPPPIPPRVPQVRAAQPKRKPAAPPPIPRAAPPVAAVPDAYATPPAPTAAVTVRPSAAGRATRASAPLLDGSSPRSLRAQFVLSEILKPPVSMRDPR
jgi:hypothetical protein